MNKLVINMQFQKENCSYVQVKIYLETKTNKQQ